MHIQKRETDLSRLNTPGPQVSRFDSDEKQDSFDREEEKDFPKGKIVSFNNSNVFEESKDQFNFAQNEYNEPEEEEKALPKEETKEPDSLSQIEKEKIKKKLKVFSDMKNRFQELMKPQNEEDNQSVSDDEKSVSTITKSRMSIQSLGVHSVDHTSTVSHKRRTRSKKRKKRTKQVITVSEDEEDFGQLEGGEDDLQTGPDINTGADINTTNTLQEIEPEVLKPKKKKKKIIKRKKKPNQADFSDISEVSYNGDDQLSFRDDISRKSQANFQRNDQFDSKSINNEDDNVGKMTVKDSINMSEFRSNTFSRPGTGNVQIVNEKATERHYDGKILCKTLFYSHRFTNVFTYYNDRSPRLHRLLFLYVSLFLSLFLSGVFFLNQAEEKDVGGWSYGHCLAFTLCATIINWLVYMILTFLFLFKSNSERLENYRKGEFSSSNSQSNNENNENKQNSRPFTTGKSKRFKKPKKENFELDPKRKKINLITTIITCVVCGVIIAFCWAFIIAMSAIYSQDAGHLWGVTFALVLVLDYGLIEILVYYISSKIVFAKDPSSHNT